MKKLLLLVIFILSAGLLFNCGNNTPSVIPTVDFSHERKFVEPGVEVEFISTATDAVSYAWDFGDGNSSTETQPTHAYTTTGPHVVTLTVTSSTGHTAQQTSNVSVGNRCVIAWAVESIEFVNSADQSWDEDGGPDVLWGIGSSSAEELEWFELGTDLVADDFPVYQGSALKRQGGGRVITIPLTDENWTFTLLENNEPFSEIEGSSEVMATFELNPIEEEPDYIDYDYGSGYFKVSQGGYSFIIEFEFIY